MKSNPIGLGPIALICATALGCSAVAPDSGKSEESVGSTTEALTPIAPQDICEFTAYSRQKTTFQDRALSGKGFVGSASGVELGNDAKVTGDVRATGTVLLHDRVQVSGNITAGGAVTPGHQDLIGGTVTQNTPVSAFTIPTKTVTAGTADFIANGGQSRTVTPGSYRDLHFFAGSTVTFRAGTYNVRTLVIESSSVHVIMDISSGPIDINAQGLIRFGDGMRMDLTGGTNPRQVRYYSNFTTQIPIGNDSTLFGVLTAPNADIVGFSRTQIRGSLFGRTVSLGPDNNISGACGCGNGFVEANEQCDDGNTNNNDGCTNACKVAVCGDGIVHAGVEECDDGNTNDLDSCTTPGAFGEPGCEFRPLRKNIAKISQAERTALINAIVALNSTPSLVYPDGVTFWDKQDQIHQATHVHGGPSFMPWHRELINRFEKLLRQVDPTVALHYWDWTTDPLASDNGAGGTLNIFTNLTMGNAHGRAGDPFSSLDNNGNPVGARSDFDTDVAQFLLPPREIDRDVVCGTLTGSESDASLIASADGLPQDQQWESFRNAAESIHNERHGCIGGTLGDAHTSFQDPFVFLLHSNNDRLFAMWQVAPGHAERLDPAQVYGADTGDNVSDHGTAQELQPWNGEPDGCFSPPCPQVSPWVTGSPEIVHKTSESPSVVRPPHYDTM